MLVFNIWQTENWLQKMMSFYTEDKKKQQQYKTFCVIMSGTWCDYFVLGVSGEKSNWPIELVYFGLRVSPSLSLVWDLSEISEGHVGWTEINAWLSVQETNIQHQSQPSEQPSVLAVSDVTHQISIIISLAIRPGSQWVSSMNRNGMGILELLTGSWNNEHTLIVNWYYL